MFDLITQFLFNENRNPQSMLNNTFRYFYTQDLTFVTQLLKKLQALKLLCHFCKFANFLNKYNSQVKLTIDKNVAIHLINNLTKFENHTLKTKREKSK